MSNLPDIQTSEDVKLLVDTFYGHIRQHPKLGPIFKEVIQDNWDTHLPKMYAFWEAILFQKPGFTGHPMRAHRRVNERFPLTKDLFQEWLKLFKSTLDTHFSGPTANMAFVRATSIATVTQIKLGTTENIF